MTNQQLIDLKRILKVLEEMSKMLNERFYCSLEEKQKLKKMIADYEVILIELR